MPTLKHLELFGGIGGFSVAIRQWYDHRIQTTAYCDIDRKAIAVYRSHFPNVAIHHDIRNYFPNRGEFDLITCGFPCTGTSGAGTRTGIKHPESALWREGLRILATVQPRYFIWEQPVGIVQRGLREIVGGCRMAGYSSRVIRVAASELGACHQRERIFVICTDADDGERQLPGRRANQMRTAIEAIRGDTQWLSIQPGGDGGVDGISAGLVRGTRYRGLKPANYTAPNRSCKHRHTARRLAGKCVTPAQAGVALAITLM